MTTTYSTPPRLIDGCSMTHAEWDQLEAEWRELWTEEGIDWRTAYDPIPVLISPAVSR